MKRIIAVILTAMMLLTLTACDSKQGVYVQSVAALMSMGGIAPGDRFAGVVVSENVTEIPKDADEDTAFAAAIASEKVANLIAGKQIVKKIYVKNKIFNLIVK